MKYWTVFWKWIQSGEYSMHHIIGQDLFAIKTRGGNDMNINDKISFEWPFGWDAENMGKEEPDVNLLMKAMIEKNVTEMNRLFSEGATIQAMDESTFKRALFHLLTEYDVIKCLVDHGFIGMYGDFKYYDKCFEPETYSWGILARAWYLGNYDVFELLAKSGFSNMYICSGGEGYCGEELIIRENDIKAVKILLENGYSRNEFMDYKNKYPESDVIMYLKEHPIIHRKTLALDNFKFKEIPYPRLETPGFFNRKRIKESNLLLLKDYEDRVEAQNRFKVELGADKWQQISNYDKELDDLT